MRTLPPILLALAVLWPAPARPCLLVTADGPIAQTGLRVLHWPTTDGTGTEVLFQVAFSGDVRDATLGILLPLSVPPEPMPPADDARGEPFFSIAQATEPTVIRPAPSGCAGASCNGGVVEPPRAGPGDFFFRFEPAMNRLHSVSVIPPGPDGHAALDDWLDEHDLALGGARSGQRAVLEAVLDSGGHLLAAIGRPFQDVGATVPIGAVLPRGHHEVPLAAGAACASRPFDLELYVVAGSPALPVEEAHAGLQALDRDLVRATQDLDAVIRAEAAAHGRRFLLTEFALPVARLDDIARAQPGLATTLGARGSHLTRMRSILDPAELHDDLWLAPDPAAPLVEPVLDVSFDPRAHGASLAPAMGVLALFAVLRLASRRRRA